MTPPPPSNPKGEEMARDLNRIMEDVRNAREVFVTEDGRIEDAAEAEENESTEAAEGTRKTRTRLKPEVFGDTPVIHVATDVLDEMHGEASRFPGETGGIVIGPSDDTVTGIIPSGPDAGRSFSSFQLDAAYLQPLLERAEDEGKRFLGIWHVHPSGVGELSSTDHKAATRILSDPDWNVSRLIMPLSVRSGSGFHTEVFVARLDRGRLRIQSARLRIASHTGRDGRGRSSAQPPSSTSRPAPSATDSRPVRLAKDCHELRNAGWNCAIKSLTDKDLVVTASRTGVELMLFVPPEYPLSPPEVMAVRDHALIVVPFEYLPETDRWSSRRSLLEVLGQAETYASRRATPGRLHRAASWFRRKTSGLVLTPEEA